MREEIEQKKRESEAFERELQRKREEAERAAEDLARKKRDLDASVKATKDKAAQA
jgi:hypothetical protein